MSRVILARRVHTAGGDMPAVHAWRVPEADDVLYRSACGQRADLDDLDEVQRFTGVPCAACALLATGAAEDAEQAVTEAEAEPVVIAVDGPAAPPEHGSYHWAVALRGVRHAHLVEPGAIRGHLDDRDVVQTLCCHLAWGPHDAPPPGWPVCDECTEIAAAVRT